MPDMNGDEAYRALKVIDWQREAMQKANVTLAPDKEKETRAVRQMLSQKQKR